MRSRAELAEKETELLSTLLKGANERCESLGERCTSLVGETLDARTEIATARLAQREAEEQLATMTEAHTTRWRIGSVRLDPHVLTSNLRRVVPSIKVERDGHLYVIYSDVQLDEADLNRVKAEMQSLFDMDLT